MSSDDAMARPGGCPREHALYKASYDPFVYGAFIRGFGAVMFEQLEQMGDGWVRLWNLRLACEVKVDGMTFNFERGLEVREKDIIWIADAPQGS